MILVAYQESLGLQRVAPLRPKMLYSNHITIREKIYMLEGSEAAAKFIDTLIDAKLNGAGIDSDVRATLH